MSPLKQPWKCSAFEEFLERFINPTAAGFGLSCVFLQHVSFSFLPIKAMPSFKDEAMETTVGTIKT